MDEIRKEVVYEVTKAQYDFIRIKFSGRVAHRHDKEENKYYVKSMPLSDKIDTVIETVIAEIKN